MLDTEMLAWAEQRLARLNAQLTKALKARDEAIVDVASIENGKPTARAERLYWDWRALQPCEKGR